jgi:hypothetical protein
VRSQELRRPGRQEQAVSKVLVLVLLLARQPNWTWHDLLKQLALAMPPETRP